MLKIIGFGILGFMAFIAAAVLFFTRDAGKKPDARQITEFEKLPYYKNGSFQNPEPMRANPTGDYEDKVDNLITMLFSMKNAPKKPYPFVALTKDSFPAVPADNAVYWLGHSSGIMELNGKRLGVDLIFDRASPVPFTVRRYQKSPIDREQLPRFDYVLLTHNHYDHMEKKTVLSIKSGRFIVPLGVRAALVGWGISLDRITEIGWRESFEENGIKITAVEGMHFSGRGLTDANKTLWNSYIIQTPDKTVYWGGDSGYGKHFADIGAAYGPFDWAALEIDAWNGGWAAIHMFPRETVQAALDLRAAKLLPIHWAAYNLANHDWRRSIGETIAAAKDKSLAVMTPKTGEKLVPGETATANWWDD